MPAQSEHRPCSTSIAREPYPNRDWRRDKQQGNLLAEIILPQAVLGPTVFLTIDKPSWPRIEAELGFFRSSNVEVRNTPKIPRSTFRPEIPARTTTDSFTITVSQVGVGVMPRHVVGNFARYYGGRVGFLRTTALETFDGRISEDPVNQSFFIGPVVGGEYFPVDRLSLGGEVQFIHSEFGQTEERGSSTIEFSFSNSATRALLIVRFFFR